MRSLVRLASNLADLTLDRTARDVRRANLTYLNALKLHRMARGLRAIENDHVEGAILEFGVALGGSAIILGKHALAHRRAFHGYDVFATIPPPTSDKDDERSKERYRTIAEGKARGINGGDYYGYEDNLFSKVQSAMAAHGVPVDGQHVQLHRGLFEQTWDSAKVGKIAYAHIDCDWFDPVAFCLDAVADLVQPGGIILLDDYNDYGGARQATDEFRVKRPDFKFERGLNPILRKLG